MSKETLEHLNTSTLIGNTDARGTAWHYRATLQGEETNHYPGPIPVADVERRLFHWHAESRRLAVETPATIETMTHLRIDGTPARWQVVDDKQAITRSDETGGHVMGIFAPGYTRHQYKDWLLTTVANILDDARGKKLTIGATPDPSKFVAPDNVEHKLFAAVTEAQANEKAPRAARDYTRVFEQLEQLRPVVAAFFDKGGVMVMDPDAALRDNRLALLAWFIQPYLSIADFRLLAGAA